MGEALFEKGFENYSSEKKEVFFFWNYILVKHFLKKDSKIIVPKKKELYFFLELYFGETLLKKDSKIIVPKKKELFFWNYILVKHF